MFRGKSAKPTVVKCREEPMRRKFTTYTIGRPHFLSSDNGRIEDGGRPYGVYREYRYIPCIRKCVMLHAAGQAKRGGDSCQNGDDEVDDHLPRLFLCGFGHNNDDLGTPPLPPPLQGGGDMFQGMRACLLLGLMVTP